MERRGHRNTEPLEGKTMGIPSPDSVSTKQRRIAKMARQAPGMAFTSLSHHIDMACSGKPTGEPARMAPQA